MRVGTVGTLSSGRLVLVLDVDPYKATVLSLPQQLYAGPFDDAGRYLSEDEQVDQAFVVTPYVSITPVVTEMLGDINRQFIAERPTVKRPLPQKCARCGRKFHPTEVDIRQCAACLRTATRPAPAVPRQQPTTTSSSTAPLKIIGTPKPPYVVQYQKFERDFTLVLEFVASHGEQGRDAVIKACTQHTRWVGLKSGAKAVHWFLRQLEKAGLIA